jgi:hypothetical protein
MVKSYAAKVDIFHQNCSTHRQDLIDQKVKKRPRKSNENDENSDGTDEERDEQQQQIFDLEFSYDVYL